MPPGTSCFRVAKGKILPPPFLYVNNSQQALEWLRPNVGGQFCYAAAALRLLKSERVKSLMGPLHF